MLLWIVAALAGVATAGLTPVANVNTTAYLGHWYQVYSDLFVEASFENASLCDTADYGLWPNGTISVLNRERQYSVDGPERTILGWAAAENTSRPGELSVHLEGVPLGAPYWIYELGPATFNGSLYQYSVVSDPLLLSLFILARNVSVFMSTWAGDVLARLEAAGFNGLLNTPLETVQMGCVPF
jgi:lipocalin